MDQTNLLRKLSFEVGIAKPAYQMQAVETVSSFLNLQKATGHSFSISPENKTSKITVRVKETPPSVQIIHSPQGGQKAGQKRVQEKLFLPEEVEPLVTVSENDLTRETIVMNLKDSTLDQILTAGLMTPRQIISLIQFLYDDQPNLFIVVDRFLFGIEPLTKTPSPFKLVEMGDKETWGYLKNLSTQFS